MICAVIIPDPNVVACPGVTHFHVMILQDVPEQECQEYVRFFWVRLDDVLCESDKCQSKVSMRDGGPSGVAKGCENTTTVGHSEPRCMDASLSGIACGVCMFMKEFTKFGMMNMKVWPFE